MARKVTTKMVAEDLTWGMEQLAYVDPANIYTGIPVIPDGENSVFTIPTVSQQRFRVTVTELEEDE